MKSVVRLSAFPTKSRRVGKNLGAPALLAGRGTVYLAWMFVAVSGHIEVGLIKSISEESRQDLFDLSRNSSYRRDPRTFDHAVEDVADAATDHRANPNVSQNIQPLWRRELVQI